MAGSYLSAMFHDPAGQNCMTWLDSLLDWIARAYYWYYCKFLQRPPGEPFTRQASRFEQRWPAIAWGISLIILFSLARFISGWWLIITLAVNLAALWFFPHIVRYRVAHPENMPYKNSRFLSWSMHRLKVI
jgi:hypothetical protein